MGKKVLLPKTKCCVSSTRCDRCPIRLLKEGALPAGYGVRKRKLVRLEADGKESGKGTKVTKAEIAAAVRKQSKKSGKKKLAA